MRAVIGFALLLSASITAKPESIFDFDSDAVGMATPFTDTNNGVSATFSTAGIPGRFGVSPSFFTTLTGNVLISPGLPAGPDTAPYDLTIDFSSAIDSITLKFALNAPGPLPFTLTAFSSGSGVGSQSVTESIPSGMTFPEGTLGFSGSSFNRVTLNTTALNFAVDDISVTPATSTSPEPASWCFIALGGIAAATRLVLRSRARITRG